MGLEVLPAGAAVCRVHGTTPEQYAAYYASYQDQQAQAQAQAVDAHVGRKGKGLRHGFEQGACTLSDGRGQRHRPLTRQRYQNVRIQGPAKVGQGRRRAEGALSAGVLAVVQAQAQQIASLVEVVSLLVSRVPGAPMQMPHAEPARARAGHAAHSAAPRAAPAAEAAQPARPAAAAAPVASAGGGPATERPASGATRAASARGPSRRGGLPARVGDTSLRRSFVLSIPVARGANWFLAGGGRRMDEEEATAAAAERIAAAAEDGTSLPVRLATDVVRFLYGGTGRREPADGGVVSASLLNAKPAVGGIGVEPRGGGVLHELRRCVDSTAVFEVLSDREEAQHQALWPAFLAAKVAGKRAQFHRARLVVDGERGSGVEAPGRARARAARPLSSGTSALYQVDMECDEAHATAVKGALHARMAPLEVDCGRMRAAPAMLLDSGGPVDDAHYLGLHAGPGVQHQLGTIEEGADDEDHDSYGHGAGDGDDDEDGAGPGGGGSAEAAIAAAAAAAAAAAGPSDERAANLVLREHALAAERQKRVQVDQLLAERRAFEDRQKATAAAAAVGAAAAAVGKEALQADRDREERMLDATQSAGRKRAGGDEELDAADDAPLGTPVGLRQPEPRRGEAAPEAAEDGEEGRRMARRRTGGDEGGVAMPAAAPAAAGPDGIPVDVWRKLGEPAFVLLAAVFTAVGAAGETPPGFLDGVVASIYKAKDAADAANYRPLTMLGSDYRILAKVLATRWTPLLAAVVGPEQTAFLAGRRISDNICLTQMLPGLLAANAAEGVGPTGAALALLDFRKAYDTIDRGCLLAVMEAVGVGDGVLAWTRTILTHTYALAEVNGFISEPRRYAAGVRQGCPAAPALFLFLGHALACFLRTCPAVCAGLRTLEAAVPGLWRLPLLSACKEPIWRLWLWNRTCDRQKWIVTNSSSCVWSCRGTTRTASCAMCYAKTCPDTSDGLVLDVTEGPDPLASLSLGELEQLAKKYCGGTGSSGTTCLEGIAPASHPQCPKGRVPRNPGESVYCAL
ncbi:hypothetical protein FOA52_004539 [Chlamydomonas sp. UWO 241]|nr:hypothetical protein FOA52_004539 [Chlamydomonas sp. UWO 241]